MTQIILGEDEELVQWAETRFPDFAPVARPLTAIGFAASSGDILGVAIYNNFRQHDVECITAKSNKRCRKLLEGVGFRLEGVHPYADKGTAASCTYGIYYDKAMEWING